MTIPDEVIRLDLRKVIATIIRATNITTYMVAEERRKLDPYYDFEINAKFPSGSGIVTGDLILIDNNYYLVMAVESKQFMDHLGYYRTVLYKCNSVVSDYRNDANGRPTILNKSNIHCLITQSHAQEWDEDKTLIIKQYRGKQKPFQIFTQADSNISAESILVDQDNRYFKVSKEFDIFIADNILQAEVMWER